MRRAEASWGTRPGVPSQVVPLGRVISRQLAHLCELSRRAAGGAPRCTGAGGPYTHGACGRASFLVGRRCRRLCPQPEPA